jgi:hypothetical protein
MSFRLTVILLAVLTLLAGAAYALERTKPKQTTEPPKYLYKFQYEDIVRIDIDLPEKSLHIKQTGSGEDTGWEFTDGTGAPADNANASNVQLIMSGPAYARIVSQAALSPDRLAEFGLTKPAIAATITMKNGTVHKALLGDKTPDGKYHYAKNADSDTIYLIDKVWGDELVRVVNNPPVKQPT